MHFRGISFAIAMAAHAAVGARVEGDVQRFETLPPDVAFIACHRVMAVGNKELTDWFSNKSMDEVRKNVCRGIALFQDPDDKVDAIDAIPFLWPNYLVADPGAKGVRYDDEAVSLFEAFAADENQRVREVATRKLSGIPPRK